MSFWLISLLLASTFAMAFVSGVTSLGGGTILMGLFAWVMPVSVAMILHGCSQIASNASRAVLYWRHIRWEILGIYGAGAAVCIALFAWLTFVPDKVVLFLLLGAIPFVNYAVPRGYALDVTRPGHAAACGLLVTACLLTAGVSGPLLDVFYVKTRLTRFETIATKGVTQTAGHVVKVIYFAFFLSLLENGTAGVPAWVFVAVVPLAWLGVVAARRVVHAISDDQFRRWTQWLTMAIGVVFLWRGVSLAVF